MQCCPGHRATGCHRPRRGLSLLEVLVSTAILVGSLTAIMQLLNIGHTSRLVAVQHAEAVLRCESVMGEIVSGVLAAESAADQAFEDESGWIWSSEVTEQGSASLLQVTVTVKRASDAEFSNVEFSLTRFLRDPELFQTSDSTGGQL